jgi:hypothetical protein
VRAQVPSTLCLTLTASSKLGLCLWVALTEALVYSTYVVRRCMLEAASRVHQGYGLGTASFLELLPIYPTDRDCARASASHRAGASGAAAPNPNPNPSPNPNPNPNSAPTPTTNATLNPSGASGAAAPGIDRGGRCALDAAATRAERARPARLS